ncbi:MAG: DEAD/DEAH box helicase [Sphaerochaeta sp.]|nr:DEAD/DEAH box helicase [Sphaerochaeta sp.]
MTDNRSSESFELLDRRIQFWIWNNDWNELRDIQEKAIPHILSHDRDVILSSGTASGKTEAAFLPILTHMLRREEGIGLTVYISPLVALINDQYSRLLELCESLLVPVYPWHSGIPASRKKKMFANPSGVLLITPESLEALFCNHGGQVGMLFSDTQYIVIDELHSFIGTERGKQLQTLMHLLETAVARRIPRIGLSATLGDMNLAAEYLRKADPPEIINSDVPAELKILMKGYTQSKVEDDEKETDDGDASFQIAKYVFPLLKQSNNLVFPNSRAKVEYYTKLFSELCEENKCPNGFFAHHGNLAHTIREEAEATIKEAKHPTTIVCTNTLELGIDIGSVESIVQIGAPPSVASLRQRLGRSGREKGKPSILRAFTIEEELSNKSTLVSELREHTIEFCAMINLLLLKWFEPPRVWTLNFSTLVQQILALISQHGGISVQSAYRLLCDAGPFDTVTKKDFMELLRSLSMNELITQDSTGLLFHGKRGEQLVNHYSFYAAFDTEKEFRIVSDSKTLGTLPVKSLVAVDDFIIFAGKSWIVTAIDMKSRTIQVSPQRKGKPPVFYSSRGLVHSEVRAMMRKIYEGLALVPYADAVTKRLVEEGQRAYVTNNLKHEDIVQSGSSVFLFSWLGDDVNEALGAIFRWQGFSIYQAGMSIVIPFASKKSVFECIGKLRNDQKPTISALLSQADNLEKEKWDWALSRELLEKTYESTNMDLDTAWKWIVTRPSISGWDSLSGK